MPREAIAAQLRKMRACCAPGGVLLVMHVAPRGRLFAYQDGGRGCSWADGEAKCCWGDLT